MVSAIGQQGCIRAPEVGPSLQNTAKIMSSSMATYLAQNPENTPILSAENSAICII
jgi:hypothetical protein